MLFEGLDWLIGPKEKAGIVGEAGAVVQQEALGQVGREPVLAPPDGWSAASAP